ncbi:MAG: winged helix-turn-helix transcriptional regulator [Planctomycetes bacterium]|nr:winged helix-turn-helix transcriptional regulator [Planctomycetota bacterium]
MARSARPRRHRPLSEAQLEAVARRFRALAVPSRLRVLDALMNGPLTMSELAEATGLAQSNLSRQVAELAAAGCVARERDGREVIVSIADATLGQLCDLVCGSLARQASSTHRQLSGRR